MGLSERIGRLFGRNSRGDANVAANRARQQEVHGQGLRQTGEEQAGTRQRMESELDAQRAQRAHEPGPDA